MSTAHPVDELRAAVEAAASAAA
ncbi:MAG: hypothetical protein JWR63_787, partial [Conexibacter sp.]|nr:hypothetical protein [Conexibacter sp.]